MNVKERLLAIRLVEKQQENGAFFDEIGVEVSMNVFGSNSGINKYKDIVGGNEDESITENCFSSGSSCSSIFLTGTDHCVDIGG